RRRETAAIAARIHLIGSLLASETPVEGMLGNGACDSYTPSRRAASSLNRTTNRGSRRSRRPGSPRERWPVPLARARRAGDSPKDRSLSRRRLLAHAFH